MIRKQTKQWTIKGGKKIRICDMETDHIQHCIVLLEKFAREKFFTHLKSANQFENLITGEQASHNIDMMISDLIFEGEEQFLPDIYENLQLELTRRNAVAKERSK